MSSLAESSDLRDFRVAEWLVQPSRNRLVRGDTSVRVRPQLIDVLVCLSRRPGSVVSKDELLASVWGDRFVAESGIARCVAELRQALADDARTPKIIETIPKRGYRLVAPVARDEATPARLSPSPHVVPVVPVVPVAPPPERMPLSQHPIEAAILAMGVFLREHVRLMVR
jgi:DNA-binding winged helix-turn-helix (wHTH) protein